MNFINWTSNQKEKSKMSNTKLTPQVLVDGLNHCTNFQYHSDRKYISSSVLKTVYKDIAKYHKEYILGEKNEISSSLENSFSEGSLVHSMILEAHLTASEFNFFPGFRKSGDEFQNFLRSIPPAKQQCPIISAPQKHRCDKLYEAYTKLTEAVQLIQNGFAEQTICGQLHGVNIKTRFDYINVEKGYIADVKTTAHPSDIDSFKMTIDSYMYNLSAALYCSMAEQYYGKPFAFYFIVLSKKDFTCDVYKTSENSRKEGDRIIMEACKKYVKAKATNIWTEEVKSDTVLFTGDYEIQEI